MWIYQFSENAGGNHLYTVGFYCPNGEFHPDSDGTKEECAKRVHYLNGGSENTVTTKLELISGMIAQGVLNDADFNMAESVKGEATAHRIAKTSILIAKYVLEEANK